MERLTCQAETDESYSHHMFSPNIFQRSLRRRTNFNPDQTSVTAQTFTSTRPAAKPISRTIFSFRSVATPELFLGQLTQKIPAGASSFEIRLNSFASAAFDSVKNMAKSSRSVPSLTISQAASSAFSSE